MADVTIKSKGFFSITAVLAVVTSIVTVSIWAGGLEREVQAHEAALVALEARVDKESEARKDEYTRIQVKLSEIETKLDTNLTYIVKALDRWTPPVK